MIAWSRADRSARLQGARKARCSHAAPLSFAAPLLTVREVAAILRVSTRTVYTLCDQGRLAHVLNAIRVESAALMNLLHSRPE